MSSPTNSMTRMWRRYDGGLRHLFTSAVMSNEAGIARNVGGKSLLEVSERWES